MKMRIKVLLLCFGCILIALTIQTFLFERTSSDLIYNQSKEESYNRLNNMQNELYGFIKGIENHLVEIYNEELFIYALKSDEDIQSIRNTYYHLTSDMVLENFQTSDNIVSMYIYNVRDELVSSYRRAATPKHNYPKDIYEDKEMYNVVEIERYLEDEEEVYVMISSYYNVYRETNIVRMALKIYDVANLRETIGYIICDIDSKAFTKIIDKYKVNNNEYIWLQPKGERVAVTSGEPNILDSELIKDFTTHIASDNEEVFLYDTNKKSVLFEIPQEKYNLAAYSLLPVSLLEENQKALTKNLLLIVGLMIAITSVVSMVWTKSVISPLEHLTDTILSIRKGDTNKRVEYVGKDEIGHLGAEFNGMLDDIDQLMKTMYEDEILLNKAEYQALQAQINPHFLYNTLDTMSSIASIHECMLVSDLSQSLSNIFRYSLSIGKPYATISEEIEHLKNYLFVMNVRMNGGVETIFNIDENGLIFKIPRISIQPLVENAFHHGLKDKEGKKQIVVTLKDVGDHIQLSVMDNGVGMNDRDINEILNRNDKTIVGEGTSIGLLNINTRMKILFGETYGLIVKSVPGNGTTVYFNLPKNILLEG